MSFLLITKRRTILLSNLAVLAAITAPQTSFAQITIQGSDGQTVHLGPGGIQVKSSSGNNASVLLNSGGVRVKTRASSASTSVRARQHNVVNKKTTVTRATAATINLPAAVGRMEMVATGKVDNTSSLIVRIEKLEVDHLGTKGTGSTLARVQRLQKALGVDVPTATEVNMRSTTTVVTEGQAPANVSVDLARAVNQAPTGISVSLAPADLQISDNHHQGMYQCNNSSVSIASNHCTLVLKGNCKKLNILGNHNVVHLERAGDIQALGNHNTVTWSKDPAPIIGNVGTYNNILKSPL